MTFAIYSSRFDDGLLLDVPGSEAAKGTQVVLYGDYHGGKNQLWTQELISDKSNQRASQIISSLKANMCLGVFWQDLKSWEKSPPVVLCDKDDPDYHNSWIFESHETYSTIKLHHNPELVLTNYMDARLVVSKQVNMDLTKNSSNNVEENNCITNDMQLWYLNHNPKISDAKPATSCHLNFGPHLNLSSTSYQNVMKQHGWTLRNTVRVKEVTDSTYFCVIGWGPAGYSGIQQIDANRRVAIFSMWHNPSENGSRVECTSSGDSVVVEPFDGEGMGMKCMKDFWWELGEEITFIVNGVYNKPDENKHGSWTCSCWYKRSSERNDQLHFMATYRRSGDTCPLSNSGFYSFVEDWDRSKEANGYQIRRCAAFTSPEIEYGGNCKILNGENCDEKGADENNCLQKILLMSPTFTKVETGCDAFAKDTANAKIDSSKCKFKLETGGRPKYGAK